MGSLFGGQKADTPVTPSPVVPVPDDRAKKRVAERTSQRARVSTVLSDESKLG